METNQLNEYINNLSHSHPLGGKYDKSMASKINESGLVLGYSHGSLLEALELPLIGLSLCDREKLL